jgi:ammonia channel protein AmtB
MTIPGLALFYGGLVRTKNMLSVLMQVFAVFSLVAILWVTYGYSVAFTSGGEGALGAVIGSFSKAFLAGVTTDSTADTFTKGVAIPEFTFIAFQLTFAAITPALIVGAFAERIKFSAVMLFTGLWVTFIYLPIAHMVWFSEGYLFGLGALDFAGGTVVHINSGVAGLVGALLIGKRIGYGRDLMAPHSLTLTFVGACLLWVGWFGFNAGSNLEATGGAALALLNTIVAPAAAGLPRRLRRRRVLDRRPGLDPDRCRRRDAGVDRHRLRGAVQARRLGRRPARHPGRRARRPRPRRPRRARLQLLKPSRRSKQESPGCEAGAFLMMDQLVIPDGAGDPG